MTVTLYSITPPTSHASRYLLRPTVLVAPPPRTDILDDIDSMYDQTLEDDADLAWEKSAEITRFP